MAATKTMVAAAAMVNTVVVAINVAAAATICNDGGDD